MMAQDAHVYSEVESKSDLIDVFRDICSDIDDASDRSELEELYQRAGDLIALSYSPAWKEKFRGQVREIRSIAQDEFNAAARKINERAEAIGTDADFNEQWGN